MSTHDQSALEARLNGLSSSARLKIHQINGLQAGELKDAESALERDFNTMRGIMRELEFLAEDQEEEEDETVLGRLQQYKQVYQDIQTDYGNAKMAKKADPLEENRKLLLAGGDPTKRQRELQTEAEMVGAAQSTTGSLQRSRQVMLEQIDSTQTILASMDASHEQLQKVTTEYQGQSDVFGSSKRLLRTLKRHSTWDKLVLYGGAAMFLLVCLYVVQKRSRYFVPTFVKTGLSKLVPTWSRSYGQDIDQLTRPIKARGDDPGTDGLRQRPTHETLRNADQAQQLLQRHAAQQEPSQPPDKGHTAPSKDPDIGHNTLSAPDKADASAPASSQPGEVSTPAQPDRRFVTKKQMDDSGYGGAFAKILDSIPENVKNLDPQVAKSAGSHTPSEEGTSDSALSSHLAYLDDASSSNEQVLEAVAAAVERATEQQRHQAVSLDAGQAYPEYTAQVSSGEQSLPQHGAVLTNSSTNASLLGQNDAFDNHVVADESTGGLQQADNLQEGALPGGLSSSDDALGMQDSVTTAVQKLLNSTTDSSDSSQEDHGGDISLEQPIQADRQQTEAIIPDGSESLLSQTVQEHKAAHQEDLDVESSYQDSDDRVSVTQDTSTESSGSTTDQSNPDDSHTVYQTEPQDLASLAQSKPRHSLPQPHLVQVEPHGDDANSDVESDKRFVSQKQMDESGHGGAFAKILDSIPDNVKNQLPDRLKAEPGASPVQDNNSYANETLATGSQTSHIDAGHFAEL